MADYQSEGNDSRIADAMNFLRLANEADSNNRSDALDDLRFAAATNGRLRYKTVGTWKPGRA
tara:strand:+ start:458 stop:643 length:186 start_codon:yes stop_codon:yes gene_type:complete